MITTTYSLAHVPTERVHLCAHHEVSPPSWMPPLGPVLHGKHWGSCTVCAAGELSAERIGYLREIGMVSDVDAAASVAGNDRALRSVALASTNEQGNAPC